MKSTDKRNIYFFYGLIPGIVIGIGLSFFIFDLSFSEDKIIDNLTQQSQIIKDIDEDKQAIKKNSKAKKSEKKSDKYTLNEIKKEEEQIIDSSINIDTGYLDTLNIIAIDSISDSIKHEPLPDDTAKISGNMQASVFSTDTITAEVYNQDTNYYENSDDNIVVMRDELVAIRSIEIEGMSKTSDGYDSLLLSNESVIEKNRNIFRVELWRSPVNYQGYKLAKNKVILFGISQYDSLSFRCVNDSFLLEHLDKVYFLECDENFRQLIPLHNLKPLKAQDN